MDCVTFICRLTLADVWNSLNMCYCDKILPVRLSSVGPVLEAFPHVLHMEQLFGEYIDTQQRFF